MMTTTYIVDSGFRMKQTATMLWIRKDMTDNYDIINCFKTVDVKVTRMMMTTQATAITLDFSRSLMGNVMTMMRGGGCWC